MTIDQFALLPMGEQIEMLNNSISIGLRYEGEHLVFLFSHKDFFIEMSLHAAADDHVVKIRPFKVIRLLQPYVEDINLSSLL